MSEIKYKYTKKDYPKKLKKRVKLILFFLE